MAEQTFVNHLVAQIHSTLDLLVSQHELSRPDANLIKSKLPALDHKAHLAAQSNRYPATTSTVGPANGQSPSAENGASTPSLTTSASTNSTSNSYQTPPLRAVPLAPQHQQHQQQQLPTPPTTAPTVGPPLPSPAGQVDTRKKAKALWTYNGNAPDDLSFEKGETVVIVSEENADWWRGEVVGREGRNGLFPSNHVERLPDTNTSPMQDIAYTPPSTYSTNSNPNPYGPPQGAPTSGWQSGGNGYAPPYGGAGDPKQQPYGGQPAQVEPPQGQTVVVEPKKKGPLQGGLGRALVGGVGFGAGSAVASNIVNAIL